MFGKDKIWEGGPSFGHNVSCVAIYLIHYIDIDAFKIKFLLRFKKGKTKFFSHLIPALPLPPSTFRVVPVT